MLPILIDLNTKQIHTSVHVCLKIIKIKQRRSQKCVSEELIKTVTSDLISKTDMSIFLFMCNFLCF